MLHNERFWEVFKHCETCRVFHLYQTALQNQKLLWFSSDVAVVTFISLWLYHSELVLSPRSFQVDFQFVGGAAVTRLVNLLLYFDLSHLSVNFFQSLLIRFFSVTGAENAWSNSDIGAPHPNGLFEIVGHAHGKLQLPFIQSAFLGDSPIE